MTKPVAKSFSGPAIPLAETGRLHCWSPWGNGSPLDGLPGFNGERADPVSGTWHLGNGYRAYNPVLMRFNCPDSLSPFGAGGINPYAYCAGDPVNHTDPSGHISPQGIIGIIAGIFGLGLSIFTAGASVMAAGSVAAAVSSASTTALVVGGLGVMADVTGIVSGAMEDVNPEASSVLGWVSMATGIAGLASGAVLAPRGARALKQATAGTRQRLGNILENGLSGRGAPGAARHLATQERYAAARLLHGRARTDALLELTREGRYLRHPDIPGNRVLTYSEGRYSPGMRLRAGLDLDNIPYAAEAIIDTSRINLNAEALENLAHDLNARIPSPYNITPITNRPVPPYYTFGDLYEAPPTFEGILERVAPPTYSEVAANNMLNNILRNLPSRNRL